MRSKRLRLATLLAVVTLLFSVTGTASASPSDRSARQPVDEERYEPLEPVVEFAKRLWCASRSVIDWDRATEQRHPMPSRVPYQGRSEPRDCDDVADWWESERDCLHWWWFRPQVTVADVGDGWVEVDWSLPAAAHDDSTVCPVVEYVVGLAPAAGPYTSFGVPASVRGLRLKVDAGPLVVEVRARSRYEFGWGTWRAGYAAVLVGGNQTSTAEPEEPTEGR